MIEVNSKHIIKCKVGRKEAKDKDRLALDDLLLSQEKRKALLFQINRLTRDTDLQTQRQKALNEDVKASAENLGLSVGLFKAMIKDAEHKDLKELIATKTSYVDVLTVIDEASPKEVDEDADGDNE